MDFLPYYYREADTYKVNGKGILERYLEIFGNYFEDYIVKDTKDILDILDIDNCPEIYLNYLWEFLGQMPFAYGSNIDAEKWKAYFNGFASDEEMAELSQLWIIPKEEGSNFSLSTDQVRTLLKYSVSLFKIRGTEKFFQILFKMYGLTCEIGMPPSERFTPESNNYWGTDDDFAGSDSGTLSSDYEGREMYISRMAPSKIDVDDANFDDYPLDKRSLCTRCITIPVNITGHPYTSSDVLEAAVDSIVTTYETDSVEFKKLILDNEDHILYGLRWDDTEFTPDLSSSVIIIDGLEYSAQDVVDYIISGESTDSNFIQFQKICEAIFDRFLPFNVQADINYGFDIPCTYHISTYLKEGDEWLFLASDTESDSENLSKLYLQDTLRKELQIKVLVSRSYRNRDDLTFKVGSISQVEPGETPTIITLGEADHTSGFIVRITRALENADYLFRSTKPNFDGTYTSVSLRVSRNVIIKDYNLSLENLDGTTEITPDQLYINVKLTGLVTINGESTSVRIRKLNTGEVFGSPYTEVYTMPGVYEYALVDFPVKKVSIKITRSPEIIGIHGNLISEVGGIVPNSQPEEVILNRTITAVGETVKAMIHLLGSYDFNDYSRWSCCIEAIDSDGNLIDSRDLEFHYKVDYDNKILTFDYGHGAIPLINTPYPSPSGPSYTLKPIRAIRVSCLKKVVRSTSQYLQVHKRKIISGEEVHEYTNLWGDLKFRNNVHLTNEGTEIYDPDWVTSDWLDVTRYQDGFTQESTSKAISRLEFHLICSKFRFYEISNRTQEYNNGEIFETASPGNFIFKPVLSEDSIAHNYFEKFTFHVDSTVNSQVKYGININPQTIYYQPVTGQSYSKAANVVITVSTNLTYSEGVNLDNIYPLNFKVYIYAKSDLETPIKVISENDPNWHVNLQSSKYEKYISVQLTDAEFTPQGSDNDGEYVIQLDSSNIISGDSRNKILTLMDYVDPNKDHLILVPYITIDEGWNGKDWSENNTSATWYPTMAQQPNNFVKVKIEGTDGSMSGYNTVKVYKVVGNTETLLSQTFAVDTYPTNINNGENGTYRLRVTNGTDEKPEYVQLVIAGSGAHFTLSCNPTEVPQNTFPYMDVYVSASADTLVPSSQLYVKRIDENVWYPSGHLFRIPSPNTPGDVYYTFQVKGDSSVTCQFKYSGLGSNSNT